MLYRPDMNIKCEEALMSFIKKANTVLEWGSGGSTVMMSNIIQKGIIYSYEHDNSFYNLVKPNLKNNVKYFLVSKKDYVYAPPNIHYSVILVDGIDREGCIKRVVNEMSWDILLLHDAERISYKPLIEMFDEDKYDKSFVLNLFVCKKK